MLIAHEDVRATCGDTLCSPLPFRAQEGKNQHVVTVSIADCQRALSRFRSRQMPPRPTSARSGEPVTPCRPPFNPHPAGTCAGMLVTPGWTPTISSPTALRFPRSPSTTPGALAPASAPTSAAACVVISPMKAGKHGRACHWRRGRRRRARHPGAAGQPLLGLSCRRALHALYRHRRRRRLPLDRQRHRHAAMRAPVTRSVSRHQPPARGWRTSPPTNSASVCATTCARRPGGRAPRQRARQLPGRRQA